MNGPSVASVRLRMVTATDHEEWLRLRLALWVHRSVGYHLDEMQSIRDTEASTPVFVAELPNGTLCGMAEFSLRQVAAGCETTPIAYLEGWYVDEEWRGVGVGRLLVETGEVWALEHGCYEMASDTTCKYPGSPEAHTALGFEFVGPSYNFRKLLRIIEQSPV